MTCAKDVCVVVFLTAHSSTRISPRRDHPLPSKHVPNPAVQHIPALLAPVLEMEHDLGHFVRNFWPRLNSG
eukprot:677147-Pelagomonas_calceolata.AAC.3